MALAVLPIFISMERKIIMALKMQAAVVEQFGRPLVLQEWDIPTPAAGQIVVKTEACGVCHTDLHAAKGDWPLKPSLRELGSQLLSLRRFE